MRKFGRVCLVVLDSAGIGEMPDAAAWGDAGSNTLGHIFESRTVSVPNLQAMGLGNITPLKGLAPVENPTGAYGKCTLKSDGKDTTTGHWEMAGIILKQGFPKFPDGFPPRIIDEFVAQAKVPGVLGNVPASGTEIIKDLGEEHIRTGKPIVYTSADSVFQIAAHEEIVPIDRLYEICEIARNILHGDDEVARVIARPFLGSTAENFKRTENRHDYAVPPPSGNLLPLLKDAGLDVVCIGKIASIYDGMGVTEDLTAKNNEQIIDVTIGALNADSRGLIFSNLVDFDMLYGHRRDVERRGQQPTGSERKLPGQTRAESGLQLFKPLFRNLKRCFAAELAQAIHTHAELAQGRVGRDREIGRQVDAHAGFNRGQEQRPGGLSIQARVQRAGQRGSLRRCLA
ncbi:MAG: phosphopentomutase [Pyrinomonadaceae bacterium]